METALNPIVWHHLTIDAPSVAELNTQIAEVQDKGYELVTVIIFDGKLVAFLKRPRPRPHS